MTEKELGAIYYLDKQITRLKQRIAELEGEMIGGGGFGGMPRGNTPGNPTARIAVKRAELLEQLNKTLEERIEAEISIRSFIEGVNDPEIKTIMELRFLYKMSWVDIAAEVSTSYKDCDRTTVSKKLRKYIKKHEQIPTFPVTT